MVLPAADHRISLPSFEGPLDLLLFLIRKNEIDIYDIPIESVTKQYVAMLRAMQQLDLEIAGDFFVMAATLMEIKSRMLLPQERRGPDPDSEEDMADPRWELAHQLLQYRKFKDAAAKIDALAREQQDLLAREAPRTLGSDRPLAAADRIELWSTFNLVLRRLAERLVVGEIHDEVVTVAEQMEWLLERVGRERCFIFSQLFPDGASLRRLIATFLAVLELTRLRKLRLSQDATFSDIECRAAEENPLEPSAEPSTILA